MTQADYLMTGLVEYVGGIPAGIFYIVNLHDRQSAEGLLYLFLRVLVVDEFP